MIVILPHCLPCIYRIKMKEFFACVYTLQFIALSTDFKMSDDCKGKLNISYKWHPLQLEVTCKTTDINLPIHILLPNETEVGMCKKNTMNKGLKCVNVEDFDIRVCNCPTPEVLVTARGKLGSGFEGNWTCKYGDFESCSSSINVQADKTTQGDRIPAETKIPIWVYIVIVILTVIVLLGLCFCIRKCFKRPPNKAPQCTEEETHELNQIGRGENRSNVENYMPPIEDVTE